MSGAGNDFIVLASLPRGRSGPQLARVLCDRRGAVGADGLIVLSRKKRTITMDYWNSDGSPAFCGNGARCAALWAKLMGWTRNREFFLQTNRGLLAARILEHGRARLSMPTPTNLRLGLKLKVLNRLVAAHFVNAGCPHAIVFVPNAEKVDVCGLGRVLRHHKAFGPAGANIDFVQLDKNALILRTYERGVEAETLACGTGVVAAAFVARALGRGARRQNVDVRGGDRLSVSFDETVRLEGPGRVVFYGEMDL